MHPAKDLLLGDVIKINQQVAANDELAVRDGGVNHQVAAAENHQAALYAINTQARAATKVALAPRGAHAAQAFSGVFTPAGGGKSILVNVGGIDLNVVIAQFIVQEIADQNGQRVRFLAGGAAGAPGAKGIAGFERAQQGGKGFGVERFPGLRVTKEFRDIDEDCVEQQVNFARVLMKLLQIFRVVVGVDLRHAFADAALQGGGFVAPELEITASRQLADELTQ